MVVNIYIISPKKDQFKPVFFGLFDFSKIKRPRPRLQKTNKWSFSVLVLFGLSPVQLQSFASPRTGLSNTNWDVILLSDTPTSTAHPFCYARVLGIFHANVIYNGPVLMDHQPRHLEFLWACWFEVVKSHQEQNAYKLDVLCFVPMHEDNTFGFINPADVLRSCHLIPDFSKGKLHPDCQATSRASRNANDSKQYYVNRFVFWSTIKLVGG